MNVDTDLHFRNMKEILLFLILVVSSSAAQATAGEEMCMNQVIVIKELIDDQRKVIEEQKMLIKEQATLIKDQRDIILDSGGQNKTGKTFLLIC